MKRAWIAAVLVAAGCGAPAGTPAPASAAPSVEDSVWAVVLDSLYVHPATRQLVVQDSTAGRHQRDRMAPDFVTTFDRIPAIERETLEDFWARNLQPRAVTALPRTRTRVPVVVVHRATLDSLPTGDDMVRTGETMRFWRAFHVRFPNSSGLITLTRVGFNPARTQALLNVDRGCGGLCGDGTIVLLARDRAGRWRVVHTRGTWVS